MTALHYKHNFSPEERMRGHESYMTDMSHIYVNRYWTVLRYCGEEDGIQTYIEQNRIE